MMPHLDGWSVLSALKADAATAGIPVIMLSIVDDQQLGFALGAADYITKPIDWQRLGQAIEKHRRPVDRQRVLVVEDDQTTREMMRRLLEKAGWTVLEARNGREGLAQVDGKPPGLILLDLLMPEMDGFEFMEALRRRDGCRGLPVIVVTAKELTEEDRSRLNGEVARIVRKGGTSMEDLLGQIRSVTGKEMGAGI